MRFVRQLKINGMTVSVDSSEALVYPLNPRLLPELNWTFKPSQKMFGPPTNISVPDDVTMCVHALVV